jgi:diguanylate cyclase (GGDEF)-like protein
VRNEHGIITHYVSISRDISSLKRSQETIEFLAHHDPLTGLPNRALLMDRLRQASFRAQRTGGAFALLFFDLDRFKQVNDTLGHPAGDQLLCAVAESVAQELRESDTLARLGGDEFVALLEGDVTTQTTATTAQRLMNVFTKPFMIGKHSLYITSSLGISLYPQDGQDSDTLLKQADLAMYQAKEQGRNTYRFYSSKLDEGALERLQMENELRGALIKNEFILHYQPQIDLVKGTLVGVEALIRWKHPTLGLRGADEFIPIAEDIGIIADIGTWVLSCACAQLEQWHKQGLLIPRMSVNLSMQQIERQNLLELIQETLSRYHIKPEHLELEVTESILMRHTENALKLLSALKDMGISLAIDDFGTGYSSLSYLKRLPVHRLKIDLSFVRDIGKDSNGEAIVRAIIALGHSMDLQLLAEGVEQIKQADFLRNEGCQDVQGYLFSTPISAQEIEKRYSSDDLHKMITFDIHPSLKEGDSYGVQAEIV